MCARIVIISWTATLLCGGLTFLGSPLVLIVVAGLFSKGAGWVAMAATMISLAATAFQVSLVISVALTAVSLIRKRKAQTAAQSSATPDSISGT